MTDLQDFNARICWTACGWLLHEEKILLVHHKKLNVWLSPGGHVEEGELPHVAAEREFWEETGLKVVAVDDGVLTDTSKGSQYLPNPFASNLHWISRGNYDVRIGATTENTGPVGYRHKSCEQHLALCYFVKPLDSQYVDFRQNTEETLGIGWFSLSELATLSMLENVRQEAAYVFEHYPRL